MGSELPESSAAVLDALFTSAPVGRPELSRILGVTAPTIGAALKDLAARGLVAETGSHKGPVGRTATLYGVSARAGWVLGVDVGSTQVAVVALDLGGRPLGARRVSVREAPGVNETAPSDDMMTAAHDEVAAAIAEFGSNHGQLAAVGIALPHPVPNFVATGSLLSWDGSPVAVHEILDRLRIPSEVPVLLENNTNAAALAELDGGAARDVTDFAYLQVGVRIGLGLVIEGRLRRGATGAAGEVALIPFPFVPDAQGEAIPQQLETYLGSDALLQRVAADWSAASAPTTARQLFALAESNDAKALGWARRHAADIARLALSVAAVVDPQLIVLGGGVGQNPLLVALVRAAVTSVRPTLRIDVASAGDEGTARGAAVLAREHARAELVGSRYRSLITQDRPAVRREH